MTGTVHCRHLATHEPHKWRRLKWVLDEHVGLQQVPHGEPLSCPGNPHVPHDERCCREHKTHSRPHVGCILR